MRWIRLGLVYSILAGLGLVLHHLAEYGVVWHWAWSIPWDHGVYGVLLVIVGISGLVAILCKELQGRTKQKKG